MTYRGNRIVVEEALTHLGVRADVFPQDLTATCRPEKLGVERRDRLEVIISSQQVVDNSVCRNLTSEGIVYARTPFQALVCAKPCSWPEAMM